MPEVNDAVDNQSTPHGWTFWIDTGGTFTDCIAFGSDGALHRAKVLSSGTLQATVDDCEGALIRLVKDWPWSLDLLRGYTIYADSREKYAIVATDVDDGSLKLDAPPSWSPGTHVAITAFEEAPILASRLITRTRLDEPLPPIEMRLGTTKGTNAILERKGGKILFISTAGLEDTVTIGTQQRPDLFALEIRKPPPLYARAIGINARIASDGTELSPLQSSDVEDIERQVSSGQYEAVAVSLLNAYANPVHERRVVNRLRQSPHLHVSSGENLYPGINLLARSRTAIVNAYLQPVFQAYLGELREKLDNASLRLITSAGTALMNQAFQPKDALLSGPAGGVVAAARLGAQLGKEQIITFDMGGTSTDCARIAGQPEIRDTLDIAGIQIASPAISIETVAAGGGSICSEHLGKLVVGPESAGAHPGPACYGNGGPLTITDVNLLLGKLSPDSLEIPIYPEHAKVALEEMQARVAIYEPGISTGDLLLGYIRIANETMAGAIRKISVQKGYDPTAHTLLAYGGAGGLHACGVASILGMREILLPYDAGLFSATGVGQAAVSRMAHKEILSPLDDIEDSLKAILDTLEAEARQALEVEGIDESARYETTRNIFIRNSGQQYAMPVSWGDGDLRVAFASAYQSTFGYVDEDARLEVVRAQVRVSATPLHTPLPVAPGRHLRSLEALRAPDGEVIPVIHWEQIEHGKVLHGPLIIVNPYATYALDSGWTLRRTSPGLCSCSIADSPGKATIATGIHALDLELFMRRFTGIAEEMGAQLQRTAQSVNVRQRLDYSCAIMDTHGKLLVNAAHIPVHLGSLGIFTRRILARLPIAPGDVIISNHPAYGGSHLPDVSLVAGVFDDSGRLLGYVANRAHHAEIGGSAPGSMPIDAHSLAEEGVIIPPMYLLKSGKPQWEALLDILQAPPYPSRAVTENLADIRAALAALQRGITGLRQLAHVAGADVASDYMERVHAYCRKVAQRALRKLQDARYEATEFLDDGTKIQATVEVDGGTIGIDFKGTQAIHRGNLNATDAIVHSAVLYVIRLLISEDVPLNEGVSECIRIHLPRCFLNPEFPETDSQAPAVAGGNTESSQRLVDTLIKALGLMACGQGTMNNLVFGNANFGYYETICGGSGAGDGFHGASAVHQHMTNTRITDAEELELRYPVRLLRFAIRHNSGGEGLYRGGDGVIREIMFLEEMALSFLAQHRREKPFGMAGGQPGKAGKQYLVHADDTRTPLEGVDQVSVVPGDRIVIETPGGGGWGTVV